MYIKELNLEELKHEHPLTLVDLQLMHRDYEEDDDEYDDNDLIATQNFECTCNRCGRRIDWYHRYYYKCIMTSSCKYSLHKFCADLPKTLKFQGHPSHTLILKKTKNNEKCCGCLKNHRDGICYHCSTCDYGIDLLCATFVEQNTIHHPSHPHPLISVTVEPILSKCFSCCKKHEGRFYHCTTCFNFSINSDCLSLPIKLLLKTQHFSHRHLLTLSYSFLDHLYDCECRICGVKLEDEHLIYKCSKCMYYVHPDCATQKIEPFMSVLLPGLGNTEKNFKDSDHSNLVHLPPPDESHILSDQIEGSSCEQILGHHTRLLTGDKHLLVLIIHDEIINNDTSSSSSISLHDPMKRIKLLCDACSRPITKMPLYKCSKYHHGCDLVLHDWCARLPRHLRNHVAHPQHTLWLQPTDASAYGLKCYNCGLPCNGFVYLCVDEDCEYILDVNCAFMPKEVTHEAHTNDHLLTRVDVSSSLNLNASKMEYYCHACRVSIDVASEPTAAYYRCITCNFYLDCRCALHLPKTIRHKLDKHPLKLSYSPIEDHKSRYFCEVCEEDLDPGKWFYHCADCAQSIHSACAPLILQSEQGVNADLSVEGVYKYINMKPGFVTTKDFHQQHPVSLAPGTDNDRLCGICETKLQSHFIWKCSLHDCNFACHWYHEYTTETLEHYAKQIYIHEEGNKRMIKERERQTNMEFYPSHQLMMRPVTRHWMVVDQNVRKLT